MPRPHTPAAARDATKPAFRTLDRPEIDDVLRRNRVGRIAFSLHDRVDVEPIHYVYDDGWIYGRTAPGEKLTTLAHNHWVAFEVDEVAGTFDWRSVVVHGGFYVLEREGPAPQREAWAHALELLRTLVPETLTDDDPARFRTTLFRIHVDEAVGRTAAPPNA
jgi:nitroimidazol reductase NimA-like FMN-containing flavoprotein (pyridoxamine 5'-phosphate oxidase superfamily)